MKRDTDSGKSSAPALEAPRPQTWGSRPRVAAVALVSILAVLAGWQLWSRVRPLPPETEKSIAVLPLVTLGAYADEYFSTGLT